MIATQTDLIPNAAIGIAMVKNTESQQMFFAF